MSLAKDKPLRRGYAELHVRSNYSFLTAASHPHELVQRAAQLGYRALALTDECSVAGVVQAHLAAKQETIQLIVGSEFRSVEGLVFVLLARDRTGYAQLCRLITCARRRSPKGEYTLYREDLLGALDRCLLLWIPEERNQWGAQIKWLREHLSIPWWVGVERLLMSGDRQRYRDLLEWIERENLPALCTNRVLMHEPGRLPLLELVWAIRHQRTLVAQGYGGAPNAEQHLRSLTKLNSLYRQDLLRETLRVAEQCRFSLDELHYRYPADLLPKGFSVQGWLRALVREGEVRRFITGTPKNIQRQIEAELALIEELEYGHYFLTIHDIVRYAREQGILCQGRGSAANSVVCYCLGITDVDPRRVNMLLERFISRERNEPPDIDVDFEHERREEVIQYIYRRYGRERAALAAAVVRYRARSAVRDTASALGFSRREIDTLLARMDWRDADYPWQQQLAEQLPAGSGIKSTLLPRLCAELVGFPRHLSQHVGGFVIASGELSELVPQENAAMPGRTVIQWDKDDLEALGLMKVDVLALGMLSAIRKALVDVSRLRGRPVTMADIPAEDPKVYAMLQRADTVGVFQVESRAQGSMLPRLKPACYYDLVIQVAIVRPGPIQGDMVHPYLRRRNGIEAIEYPSEAVRGVLERTLGVPIFQEQVIQLAMVAAGFTGGEADQLRRAMARWKRGGELQPFRTRLLEGMLQRGYCSGFAERIYRQICGFGEYGFPESHAASFALLVYVSAWLKCHEPAAFACALLNSQPMGFYSASQIVQDLRRHGVTVLPPDINASQWGHTLDTEDREVGKQPALRLGLCLIKGLKRREVESFVERRPGEGFCSLAALRTVALLGEDTLGLLASGGALASLGGLRYQVRWELLGQCPDDGLGLKVREPAYPMPCADEGDELVEDYQALGLSLGPHPLALLRGSQALKSCISTAVLPEQRHGQLVEVAGLVVGRQRPGTAAGVTFVTLEDEAGNCNVVVWRATAQHQRSALLNSRLLKVKGVIEREGGVIHLIAGRLDDMSYLLGELQPLSRDYH
ncbi:error-prone DNA polymerase [Aestuariirhabdus sp. LZHN29]|uniref:error-prone DNA polymerase n=1 Tax=Aestuariirhabdus sp. LZHN29 TaxID=3417462 RepID=UPI003CED6447